MNKNWCSLFFIFLPFIGSFSQNVPKNLSDTDKLFGLSLVWKEADKNFVFFDQVKDLDWDSTYKAYIPKVLATNSTYAYYKELQRFCSLLNDGHTRVVVPWQLREELELYPPIKTALINNKVIITKVNSDVLKKEGLKRGLEIQEINGIDVHKYAKENIEPYVFYSTSQDKNVQVYDYHLLVGAQNKSLTIRCDQKIFTVSRTLKSPFNHSPIFDFKIFKDSVAYLKITRFWGD